MNSSNIVKESQNKTRVNFNEINVTIAENAEKLLDYFDIKYKVYKDRIAFRCPIHDSETDESLNLYKVGRTKVGTFTCWTHHCEQEGSGGINLIKFLLSLETDKEVSLIQAAKWVCEQTQSNIPQLRSEKSELYNFVNQTKILKAEEKDIVLVPRREVIKQLIIPSKYYLDRGYSEDILRKFDVGYCRTKGKQMYMRTVVPVYNKNQEMIGCVGRTINPECNICNYYHSPERGCPTTRAEQLWGQKWINSKGFSTGSYFYNFWNAEPFINKTGNVILVEGQGDVWRLEEAGIKNSLGLFSNKITDEQKKLLEKTGCMNVFLALDSDEPGKIGKEQIKQQLGRLYNICEINIPEKDIGEIKDLDIVKKLFRGIETE